MISSRWYGTTGRDSDYDWGDMDQPFLDVKGANAFEPVDYLCHRFLLVCFGAGMMLIKVRMLLDLKDLQNSITSAITETLNRRDLIVVLCSLEFQVKKLYKAIQSWNNFLGGALLEPDEHLHDMPGYFSAGDITEVQVILRYIYPAWAMTPGALEMVEDITKGKM